MIRASAVAAILASGASAVAAQGLDVGTSDFIYVSDLVARGFEPFGAGGANQALFGMTDGTDLYLCFAADTEELTTQRRDVLLGAIRDGSQERALPNLPVACILTQ